VTVNEWDLLWRLALALALSSVIGVEREMRQKSAGLRTYTLVGVGAAVFMLISKYGFSDVLKPGSVVLDPSRVAAQIVSGIGFIGAGIIFVRRDAVRGLTTAAGVWLTAAVGAAAGADLPIVAIATTVAYLVVAYVYPWAVARLPASGTEPLALRVSYEDGRGVLRDVMTACGRHGFAIADTGVHRVDGNGRGATVSVALELHGRAPLAPLVAQLSELEGVRHVHAGEVHEIFE